MELKIERNRRNGGFCCVFEHKGNYYYADIANTFDAGPECMIFSCDENGKVTSWLELYANRDVSVTVDDLCRCIDEFVAELKEGEE
jgi:hypothetical protein